jgi:uncharacterized protein YecA (UPF0149 family)
MTGLADRLERELYAARTARLTARAEYAAHLAATVDARVIAWPPGRNQPCWWGSGGKYKKCCAALSVVDVEPHQ